MRRNMKTDFIETFRRDVRRFERAVDLRFRTEATCCGVTFAQCHSILEIGTEEAMTVKELAARLGLDKSTLSRTVDSLVEDGYADRVPGRDDRRTVEIRLTEKGLEAFNRINATWNAFFEHVFKRIPKGKLNQVAESMTIIADALAESRDAAPGVSCCARKE
jgi:DNA-binding MarR family transcriptional regulator